VALRKTARPAPIVGPSINFKPSSGLKKMKAIHEDTSVPDGSIVQLATPEMPSEIRISVEKRAEEDDELKALLANIRLG
jgi:hypothetical protein